MCIYIYIITYTHIMYSVPLADVSPQTWGISRMPPKMYC